MLINAFNEISTGNYSVRVDFDTVTEFVEIRDSFNSMVKRLFDMEEEKEFHINNGSSYLQISDMI